jgi:hypothetical protein
VSQSNQTNSRRRFFQLGAAIGASSLLAGVAKGQQNGENPTTAKPKLDLEKWKQIKGNPYRGNMPGVSDLPGPDNHRNWPDRNKYKDVKKSPACASFAAPCVGSLGTSKMTG